METDMQMYLLSPFFVLLLWRMKATGVLSIFAIMGLLSVFKYYIVIKESLATVLYYGIGVHQLVKSANFIYLDFVQRLVPYLSGILLGYFLRIRDKSFQFSKDTLIMGSALALWAFYYTFYSMVHASVQGYVYDSRESAKFGALQPLASSFSICWFIFICVTGQAEWINRKLKWKGFLVTSRLAFAFYLIQIPIMVVEVGRNPNPTVFSPLSVLDLNIFITTLVLAVWLTLLFLFPILNMWRILDRDATHQPVANGVKKE
ncbi:hypothetical protein J437_LFUL008128 [Ladona fulva]|uniref:Acyltransferase 3 domain-containing protein n=1 Tax=Ladona fulva TaxID=123851 RepID=A0A8K0JVP4_LADFU|nr:hypothetical protein J437_LFUL008128 [Ladona fulva]